MEAKVDELTAEGGQRYLENAEMAKLALGLLRLGKKPISVAQDEIEALLARFQRNNFAIWNELLVPVAAAVYPLGALLNHGCDFNAVLSYDLPNQRQFIRVVRQVKAGEELVHTFTDLMATTEARKTSLQATYGFVCRCQRCQDPAMAPLDEEIGAQPAADDRAAALEADALYEQWTDPDQPPEVALGPLQRCLSIRRSILPPMALPVTRALSAVHTVALEAGDLEVATESSDLLIQVYRRVYGASHPLTALQQYTQGNLLCELDRPGDTTAAAEHLHAAVLSLTVTHGADNELVTGLCAYIDSQGAARS